jgi:hypothetical protein
MGQLCSALEELFKTKHHCVSIICTCLSLTNILASHVSYIKEDSAGIMDQTGFLRVTVQTLLLRYGVAMHVLFSKSVWASHWPKKPT